MDIYQTESSRIRWDKNFLDLCNQIASWSTCLSRQIGAVTIRDKTVVTVGFNGPPRGTPHCGKQRILSGDSCLDAFSEIDPPEDRKEVESKCPRQLMGYGSGEGLHLCPAVHAEENAILNAAREGLSLIGTTMYMSCGIPCKDCLKKIINVGIVEVVVTSMERYDLLSGYLLKYSDLKIRTFHKEVL